jgi:hypothetical protein
MAATLALVSSLAAAGCETTREQAAKFTQEGGKAFAVKGLRVTARNRDVRVLEQVVLTDANGSAAVVVLRNTGTRALADVPIAIAVRDARGKTIWRNDAPGLEAGLTHAALLAPGQTVTWVNDQVAPASGTPATVLARVGAGHPAPPGAAGVRVEVSGARLEGDPASGLTAGGAVVNRSAIAQASLVVAAVARRGRRIVAAGRAIVPLLKAHGHDRFQVYFIGNPSGARLELVAQPATLR